MVKASLISIGDEIISGRTVDTNAAYISDRLLAIGIKVVSQHSVGDDIENINQALTRACEDARVVTITGGLGPTADDLTREAVSKFLGKPLELQEQLLRDIEDFFSHLNRTMPQRNKVQAYIPQGAKPLRNGRGTAPGFIVNFNDRVIAALPGVPVEMKTMFEETLLPELENLVGRDKIVVRQVKCFGAGESDVAAMLDDIMQRGRNPQISITVACGVITLTVTATSESIGQAEHKAEQDCRQICEKLGKLVFSCRSEALAEVVGAKLTARSKTVAVAESCTGGLLGKLLTDVPGSSAYFTHGWVTYSNQAKVSELGVPEELIGRCGAVSEEVVAAMAKGAQKKAGSDLAIAVTGIAGPSGATADKDVGLVYISLVSAEDCRTEHFIFGGDREAIRMRSAQAALNMIRLNM